MNVVGLNQVSSNSTQTENKSATSMGKDEFLTMLVAQLQYQDPLNPMDSTGFTAQLAQFSSLEQLQTVNDQLESMASQQASSANAQAVTYIGKTVTASGSKIQLEEGQRSDINFELDEEAAAVYIKIYDDTGYFVKGLESGSMASGQHAVTWDGTDDNGRQLSAGSYSYEIMAVDADGQPVDASTYTSGKVTGVTFENGQAYLLAGALKIPLGSVVQVVQATE